MVIKVNFTDKKLLGITLFPFILINKWLYDNNINKMSIDVILNHERIHIRQQLEMLVIPFYIWYGIEYLFRYCQYRNWHKAYINICFEREAYKHEREFNYLKSRKYFQWIKYLKFKNFNKW